MDLQISKGSDVPLRQQVLAQLVFLIGTRKVKPGDSLPSVRELARRLKIHHNTVSQAYRDLAEYGFLSRRRGSRLVVRSPDQPLHEAHRKDLDDLINETIKAARERGYTLEQLRERVRQRLMDEPPDHILVVADDSGILPVLRAELEEVLDFPVKTCLPPEIASDPALLLDALVLSSPGQLPKVLCSLPKNRPAMPIVFCEPAEQLQIVRRLTKPSLIAVVSVSQYFLEMARGVLTPITGARHAVQEYLVAGGPPWNIGAADLIFCDCIVHPKLARKRAVVPYRLIAPQCIEQVRAMMAAGSGSGPR